MPEKVNASYWVQQRESFLRKNRGPQKIRSQRKYLIFLNSIIMSRARSTYNYVLNRHRTTGKYFLRFPYNERIKYGTYPHINRQTTEI